MFVSVRVRERESAWALESVGVIGNERGDYIERRKEREGERERVEQRLSIKQSLKSD